MSEDDVISYERQRPVNLLFILTVVILVFVSLWYRITLDEFWDTMFTYLGAPLGLMLIGLIFGVLSKRAIDYHPGKWTEEKKWLSFTEYKKVVEAHKDSYGHLYGSGEPCGCCCTFFMLPMFGFLIIALTFLSEPFIDPTIDAILFFLLLATMSATLGFLWGFKYPTIDKDEFFKPPMDSDEYIFVESLHDVTGLNVGINTVIGTRGNNKVLLDAEPKIRLENMPDTVSVGVQVSHSGFAYPYLVGTVYKGKEVEEGKQSYRLSTRYPAVVEQSMDGEVAVFVARFEIPKRSSSVPNISKKDFKELASLMIRILVEHGN